MCNAFHCIVMPSVTRLDIPELARQDMLTLKSKEILQGTKRCSSACLGRRTSFHPNSVPVPVLLAHVLSSSREPANALAHVVTIQQAKCGDSQNGPWRSHHRQLEVSVEEAQQRPRQRGGQAGRPLSEQVVAQAQMLPQPHIQLLRHKLCRAALIRQDWTCQH
jgi:hypothetical protein